MMLALSVIGFLGIIIFTVSLRYGHFFHWFIKILKQKIWRVKEVENLIEDNVQMGEKTEE